MSLLQNAEDCIGVKKDSFFLQCGNIPSLVCTTLKKNNEKLKPIDFFKIRLIKIPFN